MAGTTKTHGECSFFHMIYPKGDFLEAVKYLLCIYGLGHSIV